MGAEGMYYLTGSRHFCGHVKILSALGSGHKVSLTESRGFLRGICNKNAGA